MRLQVYASGSGIETGWAALIALVAFLVVSCGVRFARDDRCMICGHRLIWFLKASFDGKNKCTCGTYVELVLVLRSYHTVYR